MGQSMADSSTSLKTFKYRLYPTRSQERCLFNALECARNWYNMALAERKYAWQLEGRSVTKYDQIKQVKHYKATFPQSKTVHTHVLHVATGDVDKAFQAFFRRLKAGQKSGYPRFKGRQRFSSFGFAEYGNGYKVDGRRLKLFGIGRVAVRWHRPMEGTPKTCRIIHRAGHWYAAIVCEVTAVAPLPKTNRVVGIDVGISSLITTSDGEHVDNPQFYRAAQAKLRVLQRSLSRKQRGGKNRWKALRHVQRQQEHVANQRRDFAHKLSTALIRGYDLIALEDLNVRSMARNKHLSKSILDSGWGLFREMMSVKAASAGRIVILVNPAYTSATCSGCGAAFENFSLATRWVTCGACGLSLDRDHNAAINILKRATGRDAPLSQNVTPLPQIVKSRGKGKRAPEAVPL